MIWRNETVAYCLWYGAVVVHILHLCYWLIYLFWKKKPLRIESFVWFDFWAESSNFLLRTLISDEIEVFKWLNRNNFLSVLHAELKMTSYATACLNPAVQTVLITAINNTFRFKKQVLVYKSYTVYFRFVRDVKKRKMRCELLFFFFSKSVFVTCCTDIII